MSLFDIFKGKSASTEEVSEHEEGQITKGTQVERNKEREEITDESKEKVALAKEKLETILRLSELGGTVTVAYADNAKVELNISDTDELGRIIGKDGVAINSLQTLVRQFIYQAFKSGMRVQINENESSPYQKKVKRQPIRFGWEWKSVSN